MLNDYNIEIGAGLGQLAGKVWRIGLMGFSSNPSNVRALLGAMEACLISQGLTLETGKAQLAANSIYS